MEDYAFDAFISYSHKDLSWGQWLQRKLETFHIPRDLGETAVTGKRLRVFRDQTDLAGSELQASLRKELRASRYLIVICSPASAASVWVDEEVRYFQSLGRADRIIPFIVEGEPDSDRPELECYPEALRSTEDRSMLGTNILEIGKNKAFLKLVAILLDIRFNRLVDREKQRKRRTGLMIGSIAAVVIAVTGALVWHNTVISRRNQALSYDIYGAAMVSIAEKDVIEPDDVAFLQTSAEAGNVDAMLLLGDCYENGWGIDQDPVLAFEWYRKGAEAGDTTSMIAVSNCYQNGTGVEADPAQAFEWSRKAAEAGEPAGMVNMAISYEDGLGTGKDPALAFEWYRKAAEAGNDLGMYHLARCYRDGIGTEVDREKTFEWIKKLAEAGNAEGMYNLGLLYQHGFGTEEDPRQAYLWYRKAAGTGDADRLYMVGWCTENHYGTDDPALEWYREAADLGSEQAREALDRLGA